MLQAFYPKEYIESVFTIDYHKLYHLGYRGIIFDLDNTLVPHGADSTEEVDQLFRDIHAIGLKTVLLSDNDEPRLRRFLKNIDSPFVCDAKKPSRAGYEKALAVLELPKEQVVAIGDQIFKDVYGANHCGIDSIMVEFIGAKVETKLGVHRNLEIFLMEGYRRSPASQNRIGDILDENAPNDTLWSKKHNFCDLSPTTYAISERKEILKRHAQDLLSRNNFAHLHTERIFPNVVAAHTSHLIKRGPGIDPVLQENKAVNIRLASSKINGIVILPGQTFSFCRTVGSMTKRKGYKDGRVIENNVLKPGTGGGLCNLGNTIHHVILHSPMTITEIHHHSDALAPDAGPRQPFSSGTSVSYNNIDFRFRNDTEQPVQLLVWCKGEELFCELRSLKKYPFTYALAEEDHHFQQEADGKYYRVSKIYQETFDRETGDLQKKNLIWDNHSEVMYDYSLIPKDQIREE